VVVVCITIDFSQLNALEMLLEQSHNFVIAVYLLLCVFTPPDGHSQDESLLASSLRFSFSTCSGIICSGTGFTVH